MKTFKQYINEIIKYDYDRPNPKENISHYEIRIKQSRPNGGRIVAKASTPKSARKTRDRHDKKYGGYAHEIVPVYKD